LPPGKTLKKDCFLISGAKVTEGVGEYVVIAVGTKSFNGRLMMALRTDAESTPLQIKLNRLAELIAKFGASAGLTLFFALFIRFCVQLKEDPDRTPDEKGQDFISILIIAVTLVVVAVPEGLPLAVTLALAFATKRMTAENLLVRVLASCETAGGANVVCTDKTGTLTLNEMQIVAMSLGVTAKGVRRLEENPQRTNANKVEDENGVAEIENTRTGRPDFTFDLSELNQIATPQMQQLLNESFCINSTAFEEIDKETGKVGIIGSKTEAAMLLLGREVGWTGATDLRAAATVHQVFPFSSEVKAMATAITLPNGKIRLLVKGASEILLKVCTSHVDIDGPSNAASDIKVVRFNEETMTNLQRTIYFYASQCLRTIAVCYKDYEPGTFPTADGEQELLLADLAKDLTMITVVAIEDPLRPGVIESVSKCNKAGVAVKMCTGDNVLTARSIAIQCGMYTPGGIVIEGPAFRRLSHQERLEIVPRLQVMARSSPEDKRLLVESLRELGNIVCVTGDGSNDAPALKASNIGFAMGISGTEVAKEASDIIVMDDSFASLTLAIKWGRCVNDSVRKFLQFQLSVNVTAVVLTFITAVASDEEESVLSAVQLLWVNLIMDTFAALALATDPASERSLDRQPEKATAPLLNIDMVKMILGQACYQIVVCFVLHWRGHDILGDEPGGGNSQLKTLVFNSFVFCQIFNMINCRSLTSDLNFWHGIHRNRWFMLIFLISESIARPRRLAVVRHLLTTLRCFPLV
jgi:Ca2+-transporting ATPase